VRGSFFAATTKECDASGKIGTLVVTPGGAGAAVVVVLGLDRDPYHCAPPGYAGCIVARREVGFAEHASLSVPIALKLDCANVPCDAFTTCNLGGCVSSHVDCTEGDSCMPPGVLPDGAVDEASFRDVSPIDGTLPADADPRDAAADAAEDVSSDASSGDALCLQGKLQCPFGTACGYFSPNSNSGCCNTGAGTTCLSNRNFCQMAAVEIYCCSDNDCPTGKPCRGSVANDVASSCTQ
jgi:hypothetical protein